MRSARNVVAVVWALAHRPDLWRPCARLVGRMVPDRWWRTGPVPPREYLAYRGRAVYGVPLTQIPPVDLVRYLEWCKAFPAPIS